MKCLHVQTWKSHIVVLLNLFCCCLLSFTSWWHCKAKVHFSRSTSLSLAICISLSDTPLKSQTLMGPEAPKDCWAIDDPVRLHRSWASTRVTKELWIHHRVFRWSLWQGCSCLHCCRGQDADRYKIIYQICVSVEEAQEETDSCPHLSLSTFTITAEEGKWLSKDVKCTSVLKDGPCQTQSHHHLILCVWIQHKDVLFCHVVL